MKIGMLARNMGDVANRQCLEAVARNAEAVGLDSLWVTDHVAIPREDSEGSNGIYLDPLATLAFLSAVTKRIGLGTSVLILPYRPALPTAKWVATVQALAEDRLELGIGVGWMEAEFRALGVARQQRGRLTNEVLTFLHDCFEGTDEVTANGQTFLFRPRPSRPPIIVGGRGQHAFERAVRFGDGWMPSGLKGQSLNDEIAAFRQYASDHDRSGLGVYVLAGVDVTAPDTLSDQLLAFENAGVDTAICGFRYADEVAAVSGIEALSRVRDTLN